MNFLFLVLFLCVLGRCKFDCQQQRNRAFGLTDFVSEMTYYVSTETHLLRHSTGNIDATTQPVVSSLRRSVTSAMRIIQRERRKSRGPRDATDAEFFQRKKNENV